MKYIVIIGAGQLGSRHLQALARLEEGLYIQVMDNNNHSLQIAKERFEEVASAFKGKIEYITQIEDLNNNLDVVIVATGSNVRKSIIVTLLKTKNVKFLLLEKFLFPRLEEYTLVSDLLAQTNTKAWVNCPRRMIDFYKNLKSTLTGTIHLNAIGNGWGLACNGIHILDLFSFLTGNTQITLNNNLLDKEILESKRKGYIEITGTISGFSMNHSIQLTSIKGVESTLTLLILDKFNRYLIQEGNLSNVLHASSKNEWKWEISSFHFPFQSELTNVVISELLETGNCSLTPYSESAILHKSYLNNLINHLSVTNPQLKECLIT